MKTNQQQEQQQQQKKKLIAKVFINTQIINICQAIDRLNNEAKINKTSGAHRELKEPALWEPCKKRTQKIPHYLHRTLRRMIVLLFSFIHLIRAN